jgi:hypothetical protein
LPPNEQQLSAWRGTKSLADFPEPVFEVWDENYANVAWFNSVRTQFRYNAFGATGFDYSVAYRDFDDMGLSGNQLDEWKWKLKVMEAAALSQLNRAA